MIEKEVRIHPHSFQSVSYTHLDVYKRQEQRCIAAMIADANAISDGSARIMNAGS